MCHLFIFNKYHTINDILKNEMTDEIKENKQIISIITNLEHCIFIQPQMCDS